MPDTLVGPVRPTTGRRRKRYVAGVAVLAAVFVAGFAMSHVGPAVSFSGGVGRDRVSLPRLDRIAPSGQATDVVGNAARGRQALRMPAVVPAYCAVDETAIVHVRAASGEKPGHDFSRPAGGDLEIIEPSAAHRQPSATTPRPIAVDEPLPAFRHDGDAGATPAEPARDAVLESVSDGVPAPPQRERLYVELDRTVTALENSGAFSVLKKVVRVASPSVVHIEAAKRSLDPHAAPVRPPLEEAGAGVIVEIGGKPFVITNRHVIDESELGQIKITLSDGRVVAPQAAWDDSATDVAVVALQPGLAAPPARVGDSDAVEIGDFVLAVGSPFGLSHSVTYGIISAKGRRNLKLGAADVRYQEFLQTDAAINPGNSGGPLLNLRGEVIGINTAIASASGGNEGIGFTIPMNMALAVARQLALQGRVTRAFLGVQLDGDFTDEKARVLGLPRPMGARVTGVTHGAPAQAADIRVNDVILTFAGAPIEDDAHLVNVVGLTPLGETVHVDIWRGGKRLTIEVEVVDRARFEKD